MQFGSAAKLSYVVYKKQIYVFNKIAWFYVHHDRSLYSNNISESSKVDQYHMWVNRLKYLGIHKKCGKKL